ncbi:MAG TPA: family 10 glycosylhydrolase [Candidatus Obscuribacterales bacterium]
MPSARQLGRIAGKLFMSCLAIFAIFAAGYLPAALASSPVAVLKSAKNATAYQDEHLGTFEDDYQQFRHALENANIRYDELSDEDVLAGPGKTSGYKVIIVPLLADLGSDVVSSLIEFTRGGGKLLITDCGGTVLPGAQALEQFAGVTVARQTNIAEKQKLNWPRTPLPVSEEFAIGSVHADITMGESANSLARWFDVLGKDAGPAIVRKGNTIFLGWAPGVQGEITTNSNLLSLSLEELVPGLTQQAAVQISFADYQTISQELEYLTKRTEETIKTAKQAELAVPFKVIQQNYDGAVEHIKGFQEAYSARKFYEADSHLQQARQLFSLAFAQAMPVRPVEARSVWLDRGTIVSMKGAKALSQLFDRLKASGINVVYFETNNAGFTMYPSKLVEQNPNTIGWDPLGTAVNEAHKRGMELHAWVWVFAVGNARHNPIIGKDAEYPGPVLSSRDFSWALAAANGALVPPRQHEFWLDPSVPEARQYPKDLMLEILKTYKVDGIQLDYIRYPFNNKGQEMGFNWLGRTRFEQETGLNLDKMDDETRQVFQAWKVTQVNNFVKDVSQTLRQVKPDIKISAAVYALPRRMRINAIQQEWETWVANGWVDTLNPMTYVNNAKELTNMAGYVRESTGDRALVYPGLSIRQLDTAGLIEQLDSARETGTLGTTMFAVAHLDDKKLNVLKVGPYRKQPLLTPQSEPLRASRLLVGDFAALVNRYLQDPRTHILSDQASTNDVLMQIDAIQRSLHQLGPKATSDEIDNVLKDVTSLHGTVKNWLRLEAFIQRGFRAQYIASYLGQVEAILAYASHKQKSQQPALAGELPISVPSGM